VALAFITRVGQLPAAAGILYTATAPGTFTFQASNGGVLRTINAYVNHGGTRRRFTANNLTLQVGAAWPPNAPYGPIYLETGDSIDGDASAATAVDWVITGIQKT
jgi:hypothetical protein